MNRATLLVRSASLGTAVALLLSTVACTPPKADLPDTEPQISHSDADGIPDHIEELLGTDPHNIDSDHDGLSDYFELVEMPRRRAAGTSALPVPSIFGPAFAMAAEETAAPGVVDPEGWKEIDLENPHDQNGDGVHDALDPYGPDIEVTLDDTLVGRIHSAISKSNGWDWNGSVPTAKQYNDAFVALMMDEDNNPAPLVANDQRVVPPDLADPLTESKATAAWTGRAYEAKIPAWKLDDPDHGGDGDGIPNGFETYGFSWDGHTFVPWGFTLSGKSSYTPEGVGFEIVGNVLTPKKPEELDYSVRYFKTDHSQASSDADPYSDKLEVTGANMPQTVKSPSDSPVVAAYPTIVGHMSAANVTIKQEVTTTTGKKVTKGSASGSIKAASVYPKVPITGFVMGDARPSTGAVAKGLDFIDENAVSVAAAAISGDPAAAAKFSPVDINATFGMKEDDWSEATTVNTDDAATLDFEVVLSNTGFSNASNVQATFDVSIGNDVIRSVQLAEPIAELPAQGKHSMHVNGVSLTLDQLKSYQSGAPVGVRLNQVDAEVMVPQRDGDTVTYKSAGKWGPFASAMDNWCARITVDMGDGTFATYPVMAKTSGGFSTTLLDGLIWSLGVYEDGAFKHLSIPQFFADQGAAQTVPDFADWLFVFDDKYAEDTLSSADSIFDIKLVPGSHVYARSPISDGDRPAVPWASVSSADDPRLDITNQNEKLVSAAVNAEMAVGEVWVAPSKDATESAWTQLSDPDADGVFTATLPKTWRVVAGQPVIVAKSASRWGDGSQGPATLQVPLKATAPTGLMGTLSGTITKFPDNDVSREIVCFDFDAPAAHVVSHSKWSSPPAGTDLGSWYYSVTTQFNNNGTLDYRTEFEGYVMAYSVPSAPRWMGVAPAWVSRDPKYSLAKVKTIKGKVTWSHPSGHSKIWDKAYVGSDTQPDYIKKGETFLLKTHDGRWVKATVKDIKYKNNSTLEKISVSYTAYDPGQ